MASSSKGTKLKDVVQNMSVNHCIALRLPEGRYTVNDGLTSNMRVNELGPYQPGVSMLQDDTNVGPDARINSTWCIVFT